jgi:hypothetical protein
MDEFVPGLLFPSSALPVSGQKGIISVKSVLKLKISSAILTYTILNFYWVRHP